MIVVELRVSCKEKGAKINIIVYCTNCDLCVHNTKLHSSI